MNPLSALLHGLARVERWASRLLVASFVALIVSNVAMRYVLGRPLVFAEELAAILLVWLAFVSISISIHDRAQIGVTLLTDRLPAPLRQAWTRWCWRWLRRCSRCFCGSRPSG
mgnify:CR=1 FL=1